MISLTDVKITEHKSTPTNSFNMIGCFAVKSFMHVVVYEFKTHTLNSNFYYEIHLVFVS